MDTKIEKRLKSYNKRANIELFFELTNQLITELSIDKENPRFALSVRNVANRQRISVNINSRLIGGLKNEGKEDALIFMLYTDFANNLKSKGENLVSMGKDFAPSGNLAHADAFIITIETFLNLKKEITANWITCCKDYLPSQVSSQRRIHHLPELFNLVADRNYRNEQLNTLFNTYKMEFITKQELDYYHQVTMNDNVYKKNDPNSQEKGRIIKATIFDKTNYWASLISAKQPEYIYRADNVWQMSGYIKGYSWVRFNLLEHKNFKVFFTIGVSGEKKQLVIKLDCQRANTDKLEDEFIDRFDKLKQSLNVTDLIVDSSELEKCDWDSLANKTLEYFTDNLPSYNKIISKIYAVKHTPEISVSHPLNQIFYGSPGTGKTYSTINTALKIINEKEEQELNYNDRKAVKKLFDKRLIEGRIVFTTFHQSMNYEDFIEGIKPKTVNNQIIYHNKDGIFKKLCFDANSKTELRIKLGEEEERLTKDIFEDLYYSFSEQLPNQNNENSDFKLHTKEKYEFQLFKNSASSIVVKAGAMRTPQSVTCNELINVLFNNKKPAYISYEQIIIDKILEGRNSSVNKANNASQNYVIIIDEINRGNVSAIFGELITLIEKDKRIGANEELKVTLPYSNDIFGVPQNLYIIGTMNTADRSVEALDSALRRRFCFIEMPPLYDLDELKNVLIENCTSSDILKILNNRIEYLLNRDHLIGHSYFISINSIQQLKETFFKNIIPLLQEYFYGDYSKMSLVIGEGFFEKTKSLKDITWAMTNNSIEKPEKEVWSLKTSMTDIDFEAAIKLLLGKDYEN